MNKLNILYVHSHDTGRYIQPYGHPVHTPALQRLAEQGMVFRQTFCAAPTCSPSRAALLTGQWPHRSGMLGLAHRGFQLRNPEEHLVRYLNRAGYDTALAGNQHEAHDRYAIGYQELLSSEPHPPREEMTREAVEFLDRRGTGDDRPFFLSVGYFDTHRVFPEPTELDDPRWVRPPAPYPDTPETRADFAGFRASARLLDACIAQVLAALDRRGLAERTLVLYTTDHGPAFPLMKYNLTDHGLGVALILRGPGGRLSGGRVCDAMVSHVDLFPTICDLAGLPRPAWLQGRSMMPLIDGTADAIRDEIYGEVTYHASYEPQRCVRTRRWKYIRRYGPRTTVTLPNCDDGQTKKLWHQTGWPQRQLPREALYDVAFDPVEACNLAGSAEHAEVLSDLRRRLDRFMERTDDPLQAGHVPPPAGAIITPSDAYSPTDR